MPLIRLPNVGIGMLSSIFGLFKLLGLLTINGLFVQKHHDLSLIRLRSNEIYRMAIHRDIDEAFEIVKNKIRKYVEVGPLSLTTESFHPFLTFREVRSLSDIATKHSRMEKLQQFWTNMAVSYPIILTKNIILFELIDAHILTNNQSGLLHWVEQSVAHNYSTLSPYLVKEILTRYAYNTTITIVSNNHELVSNNSNSIDFHENEILSKLLPLLSKLCSTSESLLIDYGIIDKKVGKYQFIDESYPYLWLPLPMNFLCRLAFDLLIQCRITDAQAILRCVHPFQWPYDELLTTLANAAMLRISIPTVAVAMIIECELILQQRAQLVKQLLACNINEESEFLLSSLQGNTARALLAMKLPSKVDITVRKRGNSALRAIRRMVAKAVQIETVSNYIVVIGINNVIILYINYTILTYFMVVIVCTIGTPIR